MTSSYTSDALTGLRVQIGEAVSAVSAPAAIPGTDSIVPEGVPAGVALESLVPTGSISAKGSQPDVLSKDAREDLVMWAKIFASVGLGAGVVTTMLVTVLDLILDDQEVSGLWVWPTFAMILIGGLGLIIAHFAVMGYGNVELGLDIGEQAPETGGDKKADEATEIEGAPHNG